MFYVTGDTHGENERLVSFCQEKALGENDVVVVLGDACLNYYPQQTEEEIEKKRQLNDLGVKFFFIRGNHDRNPKNMKAMYQKDKAFGNTVYIEPAFENLIFARDGKSYVFDDKTCLVLGGASSVDKDYRIVHKQPWYPDEQMDDQDKKRAAETLEKLAWQVDYVFSHACPGKYTPLEALREGINEYKTDHTTEDYLDEIEDRLTYDIWYCGHWHINKHDENIHFLFEKFEQLGK